MTSPARGTCAVVLLAAGCFNSAKRSASDAASPTACNELALSDLVVEATSAGTPGVPVAAGGEMPGGSYHLVSSVYYPAPACTVVGVATRLKSAPSSATAGTIEIVTATAAGDTLSESVSYTVSGASLSVRIDCILPDPGLRGSNAQIPFNATAAEIQLFKSTPPCGASIDTYQLDGV
jgi:hypothetical protein